MRLLLLAVLLAEDPQPDVLDAVELPLAAQELRATGLAPAEVAGVLGAARAAGLGAGDATRLLRVLLDGVREHGLAPRLAGAVRHRLDEGLRGAALHTAVQADLASGDGPPAAPPAPPPHAGHR